MNNIITLDYELFFGSNTGTVENSLIKPTEEILELFDDHQAKSTFFVDAGYLARSKELNADLKSRKEIITQLKFCISKGHDIQLHIHPHWEDCIFENNRWIMDTHQYKLSDFSITNSDSIVTKYTETLKKELKVKPIAYRAGGWCLQPFSHIQAALRKNGILLDSTVYKNGINVSTTHLFDFTGAPNLSHWRFNDNPLIPEENGEFIELPIADLRVSPLFYWKLAIMKKLGSEKHKSFGDGSSTPMSKKDMLRFLTRYSHTVVSFDGYKASLLNKGRMNWEKRFGDEAPMVIIGHPKSVSRYSLEKLDQYLTKFKKDSYHTISDYLKSI